MRSIGWQDQTELSRLQVQYRVTWRSFLIAVRHWQTLQTEKPQSVSSVREAEATAHAAEEQHRQARNTLADYLLEQTCRERDVLLVGSQ